MEVDAKLLCKTVRAKISSNEADLENARSSSYLGLSSSYFSLKLELF